MFPKIKCATTPTPHPVHEKIIASAQRNMRDKPQITSSTLEKLYLEIHLHPVTTTSTSTANTTIRITACF